MTDPATPQSTDGQLTATQQGLLDQCKIVMVETSLAGNIGSAARALKTMGLKHLVLVNPKEVLTDDAYARSSGARDILDSAQVVDTLEQAVADCQVVMGASARSRHLPWPMVNPRQGAEKIMALLNQDPTGEAKVALVLGRESSGLTNDELAMCQLHVHIPSNPDYSSLNVAAAVQVLSYELRMAVLGQEAEYEFERQREEPLANHQQLEGLFGHLQQTLVDIDYLDPNNPKLLMSRLRRLLVRSELDVTEINILRGILKQAQKQSSH